MRRSIGESAVTNGNFSVCVADRKIRYQVTQNLDQGSLYLCVGRYMNRFESLQIEMRMWSLLLIFVRILLAARGVLTLFVYRDCS